MGGKVGNLTTKKAPAGEIRQLTMRDMLAPLFRKKHVVLAMFFAIFAVAILMAWRGASYYVSTMQVVVERERSDPTVTPQQVSMQATNRIITTDDVASEAAL